MTRGSLGWLREKDGQARGKVRARFRVLLQSIPETKGYKAPFPPKKVKSALIFYSSEKFKKMMVVVVGFERQKNSITDLFRKN